jgi:hypothetical protein
MPGPNARWPESCVGARPSCYSVPAPEPAAFNGGITTGARTCAILRRMSMHHDDDRDPRRSTLPTRCESRSDSYQAREGAAY